MSRHTGCSEATLGGLGSVKAGLRGTEGTEAALSLLSLGCRSYLVATLASWVVMKVFHLNVGQLN